MKREEVLEAARKCVCGDREKSYGSPERSFECIAGMWSVYLGRPVSSYDVACMMALLKIVRAKQNPHHDDSWTDLAGYAACGAECAEKMYSTPFLKPEELAPQPQTPVPDPVRAGQEIGGSTVNPFGHGDIPVKTM